MQLFTMAPMNALGKEYDRVMKHAVADFIGVSNLSGVYILVVKDNDRHRLLKLGMELPPEQLTEDQIKLQDILKDFGLLDGEEERPGRPHWSNKASIFLTPEDAAAINWSDEVQRQQVVGVTLQSKHIVCSMCYYDLIERVLRHQSPYANETGREAFLIRRAGVISERVLRPLPDAAGEGI